MGHKIIRYILYNNIHYRLLKKLKKKNKILKYKNILITEENYDELKKLKNAGDSFNFVVTKLLSRNKTLQSGDGIPAPNQIAT